MYMRKTVCHTGSDVAVLRRVNINLCSFMKVSTLLVSTETKQLMEGSKSLEKEK